MLKKLEKEVTTVLEKHGLDMYLLIGFPKQEDGPVTMLSDIDPISAGCAIAAWLADHPESLSPMMVRLQTLLSQEQNFEGIPSC